MITVEDVLELGFIAKKDSGESVVEKGRYALKGKVAELEFSAPLRTFLISSGSGIHFKTKVARISSKEELEAIIKTIIK